MGISTVTKRDGRRVPFDAGRIVAALAFAMEGLPCQPADLPWETAIAWHEGMPVDEIQAQLIQLAADRVDWDHPEWDTVAMRLLLYDAYHRIQTQRRQDPNDPPYTPQGYVDWVRHATAQGWYHPRFAEYTEAELARCGAALVAERDQCFDYAGLRLFLDRYALHAQGHLVELPQETFMGVALFLALAEDPTQRVAWALRFYEALSTLRMTLATPSLANFRKPDGQGSSCFEAVVPDDLHGIYDAVADFAQVSKFGGGFGAYFGHIRGEGAPIRGVPGTAKGVIPWVQLFNTTALAVDQLGQRAGAVTVWLDIWHPDVLAWLDLRTTQGDPRKKARDVFPGLCVPDAFWRAVEADAPWYLIDPYVVRTTLGFRLEDYWGEEWEARYQACVADPRIPKREILAIDLFSLVLRSIYETGTPFIFNRDTVNRLNPNAHAGMVYASNLCTEIAQNQSESERLCTTGDPNGLTSVLRVDGDFVVCNLASIHLGRIQTLEDLATIVPLAVRMLDNGITLNYLPVPAARTTNQRYRAIGLGVHGYHQYLVQRGIAWESDAHLQAADQVFEELAYQAIAASHALAQERGAYPLFPGSDWATGAYFAKRGYTSPRWQALAEAVRRDGLRNGYLLAVAPTSSTAILAQATPSVDPIYRRLTMEEKKGYKVYRLAPGLTRENALRYEEAPQIDHTWTIRAAGIRQRHLDQAQSINLYETPDLDEVTLAQWYLLAWKVGVKTIYYFRHYDHAELDTESAVAAWLELPEPPSQPWVFRCEGCEV